MSEFRTNDERLNAYLDGLLKGDQLAAFESQLGTDAELRAALEVQREIDLSIKRTLAVPVEIPILDFDRPTHCSQNTSVSMPAVGSRRLWIWGIAAVVAWSAIFVWLWPDRRPTIAFQERPVEEIYRECVAAGFVPYWDCNDQPERFQATFATRHEIDVELGELPPDGKMVGLSYLAAVSRNTTAMLATVKGQPVIVFVDNLAADRDIQHPSEDSGLCLFRREICGLVLYELTPLNTPKFLDSFVVTPVTPAE